jgi:hypothetical protein
MMQLLDWLKLVIEVRVVVEVIEVANHGKVHN